METNSALASLTATYTDSENEDNHLDEDTDASTESQVIIPPKPVAKSVESASGTDETSNDTRRKTKKLKNPKKSLRLVSYNDDTIVSDEENRDVSDEDEEDSDDDDNGPESSMEVDEGVSKSNDGNGDPTRTEDGSNTASEKEARREERWAKYDFSLPAEPKGKCSAELQDKINLLYEKMRNTDMNRVIQERKEFRNPSIYEKLIQFCDINEFGTNYPPEIYDPLQWGPESYYEELAKAQKVEMDRREKEKKDSSKVELAFAAAKKVEEEAKRRKSKWDQPGPSAGTATSAATAAPTTTVSGIKPAGVIQPALTTNITGTKGTVISAFGSLPKKPKV